MAQITPVGLAVFVALIAIDAVLVNYVALIVIDALLVHTLSSFVRRFVALDRLQWLGFGTLAVGLGLLVGQVLFGGDLPGVLGMVTWWTPVFVGMALLLVAIGGVSVGMSQLDWPLSGWAVVAVPLLTLVALFPLALVLGAGSSGHHSPVHQLRAIDQLAVTTTVLPGAASFFIAGYLAQGQLRAIGVGVLPPLAGLGIHLGAIGANPSGMRLFGLVFFTDTILTIGVVFYLVGVSIPGERPELLSTARSGEHALHQSE